MISTSVPSWSVCLGERPIRPDEELLTPEFAIGFAYDSRADGAAAPVLPERGLHGSLSAAAIAEHIAQPSLSDQVRRLESGLGVSFSPGRTDDSN